MSAKSASKLSANSRLPFLLDTDVLCLAPGFTLANGHLIDSALGASHRVHGAGVYILRALEHQCTYAALMDLANRSHVSPLECHKLLSFLVSMGALRRHRPFTLQLAALQKRCLHAVVGARYASLAYRFPATAGWVAIASLKACAPLSVAILITSILVAGMGLYTPAAVASASTAGLILFIASIVVHEAAHMWRVRAYSAACSVLQSALRIAVLHPKLTARRERAIALAGPVAGIGFCGVVAGMAGVFGLSVGIGIAALLGLFHAVSLLPWTADGKIVYTTGRILRQSRP
ncbi:MAG TPA: hypothetical protein VD735_05330 [Candidatus Saccharimonadales bacterium]|nr:hypothetical protein [Candidatus Saccharimonadales bacterium]